MMDHFRAFQKFSGDTNWARVADECYSIIQRLQSKHSPKSGLLPDFALTGSQQEQTRPAPGKILESNRDGQFCYNACRTPWRVGTDFLVNGDPRARMALDKMNQWIQKETGGDPAKINAGYKLSGKKLPPDTSLAFTAPFAVSAMANTTNQLWLNKLWANVTAQGISNDSYFGNTIKMVDLIVLSGNWWTP